jgi:Leishmanolysin
MPKKYGFDSGDQAAGLDYNSDAFHFQDAPVSTGNSIIPGTDFHVAPVLDLQAPHPEASTGLGNDITIFDGVSFAKGGPGGGGTGGSGGGAGTVSQYHSVGGLSGDAGYDIVIEFKGTGWTSTLQQAFKDAANYLTTVITDDIGGGGLYRGKVIDDLFVTAELAAIDGTGGVLGQAGPTATWNANDLTATGQMQFDVADALTYSGQGLWDDIVMHEFMHVVGFGSLWNYGSHSLVTTDNKYIGQQGVAAYQAATHTGATFIPVEDGGGSGTAGSHWDEQALASELMTGYINNENYLSNFSVMSLADLGYHLHYQDYTHDNWILA